MSEQLLGLLDPVHDRVLMDPEAASRSRRAEVLLQINADRRPQPAGRVAVHQELSELGLGEPDGFDRIGGQQRRQVRGAVADDRAWPDRSQLGDPTSNACLIVRVGHACETLPAGSDRGAHAVAHRCASTAAGSSVR